MFEVLFGFKAIWGIDEISEYWIKSSFWAWVKTESEKSIKVLAGTNLAMAVEAIFCRELMGLEELAEIMAWIEHKK